MNYIYKMNEAKFYDHIRDTFFKGSISAKQFEGIDTILKAFDDYRAEYAAYALATAYHETGHTMQPIEEYGKGKGYDYGKKLDMGNGAGKRTAYATPDKLYYGRGLVQVTWRINYLLLTTAAKKAGHDWDFLNHPELMLQMEPSAWAMKYGMLNGIFTGKKLSDYFNDTTTQPINARKIINGNDQAVKIAGYYEKFLEAMKI